MLDLICVGHASFDITMALPLHPGANDKVFAEAMQLAGGGPAANAAVCAARLGGRAGFCGYLGNDQFGNLHMQELDAEGVDCSLVVRGNHPSPVSQILAKPDGSRSVVNYKGDTPWLPDDAVSVSDAPKAMLFDGHEPLLSKGLCHWARLNDVPTVLDAGSLHRGTEELAGMVDYLVASEKFASQWCGHGDMDRALLELVAICEHVVITLGERGLIWSRGGQRGSMPAFDVEAVDSTGAGDAFHGAFAYGVTLGLDWQALLRYASAAGGLACTRLGARHALPTKNELQEMLDKKEGMDG